MFVFYLSTFHSLEEHTQTQTVPKFAPVSMEEVIASHSSVERIKYVKSRMVYQDVTVLMVSH